MSEIRAVISLPSNTPALMMVGGAGAWLPVPAHKPFEDGWGEN